MPEWSGRGKSTKNNSDNRKQVTEEAKPDDVSGRCITIHLGENIAKEITEWKDDNTSGKQKSKQGNEFHGNNIGRNQTGDKERGDDDEPK